MKAEAGVKKSVRLRKPQFDAVLTSGIFVVEMRGKKKMARVLHNEAEAVHHGIPKADAKKMFIGMGGPSNCVLSFGTVFGVSCDGSDDCAAGTKCELQKWDPITKSWVGTGGTSAVYAGDTTWRCKCI